MEAPTPREVSGRTRRRRPSSSARRPTTRSRTTTSSATAGSSPSPTSSTPPTLRSSARTSDRPSSRTRTRSNKTVTLNGTPYMVVGVFEIKGKMFGGLQRQLRAPPVHGLRPPVPVHQEQRRRHDPHRDRPLPPGPGRRRSSTRAAALLRARRHVPFNKPDDFAHLHAGQADRELQGHHAAASRAPWSSSRSSRC